MKQKKTFYTELAYILGLVILAFGTAMMECTNFGVSMVVAPAYLLHLKISEFLPFFSFGMAEYTLQAVVLLVMMLVLRRFKISYIFSFVTAVIYGFALDFFMTLIGYVAVDTFVIQLAFYVVGMPLCSVGVSLLFHTYISQAAYELFVKEVSGKYNWNINKFKMIYDCISCVLAIGMSFAFFGLWHFEGIKVGTIVCALLNGFLIGSFSKIFEKIWEFRDGLRLRKYFE